MDFFTRSIWGRGYIYKTKFFHESFGGHSQRRRRGFWLLRQFYFTRGDVIKIFHNYLWEWAPAAICQSSICFHLKSLLTCDVIMRSDGLCVS